MTMISARIAAAIAGLAAAAALSACSTATTEDHSAHPSSTSSASAAGAPASGAEQAAHNEDDVMFAQLMIPHHQQAVELSALVPDRSTDPALIKLAATISGQQQPEIDAMRASLKGWGINPDEMQHDSGHAGMTMQGMVDDATMLKLEALKGPDFDALWLKSMIDHHKGAIAMANTEIDDGRNPEMIALARNIVSAQQAEIDQMTTMLAGVQEGR